MKLQAVNEGMNERDFVSVQDIVLVSRSLAEALSLARSLFPGCFVYGGVHHIAIHSSQTEDRVAIITEQCELT